MMWTMRVRPRSRPSASMTGEQSISFIPVSLEQVEDDRQLRSRLARPENFSVIGPGTVSALASGLRASPGTEAKNGVKSQLGKGDQVRSRPGCLMDSVAFPV